MFDGAGFNGALAAAAGDGIEVLVTPLGAGSVVATAVTVGKAAVSTADGAVFPFAMEAKDFVIAPGAGGSVRRWLCRDGVGVALGKAEQPRKLAVWLPPQLQQEAGSDLSLTQDAVV